jgi:toxin YoeB
MPDRTAEYTAQGTTDLLYWITTNPRLAERMIRLVEAAQRAGRNQLEGIGKPEALKHEGSNIWSRRITDEHRLVHRVTNDRIVVLRARGHYAPKR